ncbi:uncharacterized protein LOC126349960 [Schistocerca gregaria]|uniref:uncharacterized protein LOC126349960 n=1 Tax=Schistocerca gregaria TaxID=7010 RepID=UPI00211E1307|nr:uncharacterized protein LOC126349960 [Schistocerca gregaria]XP_049858431.1 uncharacterized protein LOC126349960 [Schistocerca gregaria]XP_049858432.1 uncharacterized protein LOC126349960 [Schistocerca gregaria]XP_049858433.1 uncharacterized protein LOC126349960 [Schistocerca gregaria]
MMDCTQILDDLAFEELKETKDDKKIQFGSLEIGGKSYPIYKGENRIGRDSEACSVVIDSKALSKEHAVIDVADVDNHHLYDLSSTNKTRMGKLVLQPFIRYNIQDQATIMFADINATYHKCSEIGDITVVDDSKSTPTEDLEDTVNDLDTQMECHYEDGKLKPTVTNNIFADNIYDAPTQCEEFERDTLNESGKIVTSLTTSVLKTSVSPLLSNDTNKLTTNESESSTVLNDQSYDRSLLEGDEDMFQMSVSGSGEIKDAGKGEAEGSELTCNQQEEKKKSDCQQSGSTLVHTAVQDDAPCAEKSFTLDLSSGDETDPEDIFCAQTQQFPVSKNSLGTKNMGDTVIRRQTVPHGTDKLKGLDKSVVEDKKAENTNVCLMQDTSTNKQRVEENFVQSNFSKSFTENAVSTVALQENKKKQESDFSNKEVASGDETDPEDLFCAPTQKYCANKGKLSSDKTDENYLEELCGAPTQKFVSIDSKKDHDSLLNIPQSETVCQPPKLCTLRKQVELTVCKQSEQINEMETELSDTTLEDVICPGTQESRRMATEIEIAETPERDVLVRGHGGRKSVVEEGTSAEDMSKNQKNEKNRIQSDVNDDELFNAPTQKIENFCDLCEANKTDKTKAHSEKGECEEHPKLVAEDKSKAPPESMKESLQSSVVKVATGLDVCSDIYSQPTQRLGEWNEEQCFQDDRSAVCNRTKISLQKETDLQELFSQPTQKFCGSSTKDKMTDKQKCPVQETDVRRLPTGASKKTCENKPGNASSPSVLVFENVIEGSSDVNDIAHIREAHDTGDIFSCPTQKLDASLTEKNDSVLADQQPAVYNKYEKDIFSADTQDFPQKTESGRKLNSLSECDKKAAHLQLSTKGGMDGQDNSLSGEDEEVIKIFSKDLVHKEVPDCESEKHTRNTAKQGDESGTAGICLKNIVGSTTEYREEDEGSLEVELHLPQSQEVLAALKELESKATVKITSHDSSGNMGNNFSSPVIPRKRKSKTAGERKLDTIQESRVSENIILLSEPAVSASNNLVRDLEANSSGKSKVKRQWKDEHIKESHNLDAIQSTDIASLSAEVSPQNVNNLPDSKNSGKRRSAREKKKTWKLTETTDNTSPGHKKIVESAANETSHRRTSQNKFLDSVPENSTGKAPGKRHSQLKKAVITEECNTVSDFEIKGSSKKRSLKNIGIEDSKPSVPNDNQPEKNSEESNQEKTTNCDKNDSSVSVDFQQSGSRSASKFKEPLEKSKQASGRTRRSRITSVSNISEENRFQREDLMQNVKKSHATQLGNPNSDKRNSSDENSLEVENIGPKTRKSKLDSRADTSEDSVKSRNHKQVTSKRVTGKINSNEDDESCVRLFDHQKESQKNRVPFPEIGQKGSTGVVPENVEENSRAERRTSKRKQDEISSRRSHNSKRTSLSSVSPIDNHNIPLDTHEVKEAQPPKKKRKVTQSSVEDSESLNKDTLEENCCRSEEHAVKSVKMPRGRKTGTEQLKSVPDVTKTDSPKSREYKNVPATTRKRRTVSEKTHAVNENELSNSSAGQEKFVAEHGKTAKCDSPVKKTKMSLPLSSSEQVKSAQHKDPSDNSVENNEKSPRASHRLSARPTKTTHQVLFTGLNDPRLQTTVQNLGGKIMEKPEDCNVLVTDKVRRTYKFLCVMGQGKPIVSPDWLLKSQKSGRFLDPWEFLLNDKENETKFKFSLKKSLLQCGKAKLLTGFNVAVTPSVKPPPQEMKGIVESCGGTFIEAMKNLPANSFVVSCSEDKHMWPKLKKLGSPVVGAETLLLGVLQQKLNLNTYLLI